MSRISFQYVSTILNTLDNSFWLFDYACSNHMTSNPFLFPHNSSSYNVPKIHTANDSTIRVSHTKFTYTPHLTTLSCYLVPYLSLSLLSIGQLHNLRYDVVFFLFMLQFARPLDISSHWNMPTSWTFLHIFSTSPKFDCMSTNNLFSIY